MKKIFLALILVLLMASPSWAAWTLTPSRVSMQADGHVFVWKVVCTSDGDALSATDLLTVTAMDSTLKGLIQRGLIIDMVISPGTGGVAPDTTINVTLTETARGTRYSKSGFSNTADTNADPAETLGVYPDVGVDFKLALNDIGTSGDQVTIIFTMWIE